MVVAPIVLVPMEDPREDQLLDPHDLPMVPWDRPTILVVAVMHRNQAEVLQNLEEVLQACLEGCQGSQGVG